MHALAVSRNKSPAMSRALFIERLRNSRRTNMTSPLPSDDANPPSFFQSTTFGTWCGLLAAVGYTACNLCLRAVNGVDPFFVSAVRAIPTVVMLAPIVLARPFTGLPLLPPLKIVVILALTGLVAHVFGNSAFQYGLGVVGVAMAVPLCLGSMIVAGATLGRVVLGEPITYRMAGGLMLLIVAIFVLSGGAQQAGVAMAEASAQAASNTEIALGVAATCWSGLFYAVMGAVLRHATKGQSTITQSLTIVSSAGLVALIGVSCYTVSSQEFAAITSQQLLIMLAAGVLNALAFVALTRALQLTSLVYVHALNATQVAMAAVAGVLIFAEAQSSFLFAGISLTVAGLLLIRGSRK